MFSKSLNKLNFLKNKSFFGKQSFNSFNKSVLRSNRPKIFIN